MAKQLRIETTRYQWTHGHTPRTKPGEGATPWAFLIDSDTQPVWITGTYREALRRATTLAHYFITVLP